jgi:hypothetical protein
MRNLHAAIHVCCLVSLLAAPALQAKAPSNQLVRVPQDAKTLDVAIGRVADGGVIEMAAGTYASPPNGFTINNARKGFTVRAAAGARVLIDGGGSRGLLRFTNSARARGKKVTFQSLFFQNGYSAALGASGGITLSAAEAVFQGCSFVNNRAAAAMSGGGAVIVLAGSSATFVNDVFRGNSSPVRGGAIEARASTVTLQGGSFTANRTNLPGHNPVSYGGAIVAIDAILSITETRFEANQAGWVSGAVFAIGNWDKGSNVLVTRSTFLNNLAVPDPCCANPQPTSGGAIHAEDQTTLRVHDSLFAQNQADFGGGVDSYRADVEIDGSVFQRNEAQGGGAVAALSGDNADSSTANGAINRRSARLVVQRSLLQGGAPTAPLGGGCILVNGDTARAYGGGSVAPDGTLDQNRATVEIRNSLFSDCDAADAGGGFGGALNGALIALDLEDSMIIDSDARGSGGGGGGVALTQDSNALIVRTTFANDTADKWGGAVYLNGSNLLMDACRFYGNDVEPGISEGLSESRGTAIYSIPRLDPTRPANVSGVVANSVFAGNLGIPVWDVDPPTGPTNEMRYDNDRFEPTRFGTLVYVDTLARPGGAIVADLNALTVSRGSRGSTRKSANPNTPVANLSEGALIDVPSPNSVGAGAPAPTASVLGYAWTGRSAAIGNLGTTTQKTGLVEVPPGSYTLAVDQVAAATVTAAGTCTAGPSLCLSGDRFRAEVTWQNGTVATPGQAVSLSGDTGYFWFSDPGSVELAIKVLDGRGQNGSFWVFYGGLTNVAYTLTVTDSSTGAVKVYNNLAGRFTSAGDVNAFPAPAGRAAAAAVAEESEPASALADKATPCDPAGLCLAGSRFAVQLVWTDASGKSNAGHAAAVSDGSGYFWFTSPADGEVAVKVLDGRGLNGNFWVFFGSLTNLGYTLTVTDTQTGISRSYVNPPGKFTSRGDTAAFPGS